MNNYHIYYNILYQVSGKNYQKRKYLRKRSYYFRKQKAIENLKSFELQEYPPGTPMKVYYNPKNPKRSEFKVGVGIDLFLFPVVSLFLLLVGIALAGKPPILITIVNIQQWRSK